MMFTPEQLAESLAKSKPEEFAAFWFEFNKICEREKIDLDPYAQAMAADLGGSRKTPLKTIFKYMEYFEVKKRRSELADKES